jgi:hypothetical protein
MGNAKNTILTSGNSSNESNVITAKTASKNGGNDNKAAHEIVKAGWRRICGWVPKKELKEMDNAAHL